jgi:hypothetical protein
LACGAAREYRPTAPSPVARSDIRRHRFGSLMAGSMIAAREDSRWHRRAARDIECVTGENAHAEVPLADSTWPKFLRMLRAVMGWREMTEDRLTVPRFSSRSCPVPGMDRDEAGGTSWVFGGSLVGGWTIGG